MEYLSPFTIIFPFTSIAVPVLPRSTITRIVALLHCWRHGTDSAKAIGCFLHKEA